jgi:hypothetical protein
MQQLTSQKQPFHRAILKWWPRPQHHNTNKEQATSQWKGISWKLWYHIKRKHSFHFKSTTKQKSIKIKVTQLIVKQYNIRYFDINTHTHAHTRTRTWTRRSRMTSRSHQSCSNKYWVTSTSNLWGLRQLCNEKWAVLKRPYSRQNAVDRQSTTLLQPMA